MIGFLNGLGLLLFRSQLPVFTSVSGSAFKATVAIATACAAITKVLPKFIDVVPAPLISVVLATIAAKAGSLPVNTLADFAGIDALGGGLSRFFPKLSLAGLSAVPKTLGTLKIIAPVAVSIAAVSVLETLLAGKVFDDCQAMVKAGVVVGDCPVDPITTADNDRLLNGLGFGTLFSALFGGFGGSGLIPQTLLNMQSGGRGSLSSIAYAVSMALCVAFGAPLIGAIPLAAIAGIMLTVASNTVQVGDTISSVKNALTGTKGGLRSFVILAATSYTAYSVDIALGILLGVALTKLANAIFKE
jgi:SulP family sulfate permease